MNLYKRFILGFLIILVSFSLFSQTATLNNVTLKGNLTVEGKTNLEDTLTIGDSSIYEVYQGVIPDTTEVARMIKERNSTSFDCENLHAYIDATNNGVLDCNNVFLSLTASSNQADVSYQWDGSVSGDMGTSNPLLAWTSETITLTVTNNTTSCETTEDIEITYDTVTPSIEKFIFSQIYGELSLGAFVTNPDTATEYEYGWGGSVGITTYPYAQFVRINGTGTADLLVTNLNTGCYVLSEIVVSASDYETEFSKLNSTNGDVIIQESTGSVNSQLNCDAGDNPIALTIHENLLDANAYYLDYQGIKIGSALEYFTFRDNSDNLLMTTDVFVTGTIADNDATPDVTGATTWIYNGTANSVVITDLDNPIVGKTYRIIGNSDTYTITINDGGNFNLEGNWTGGIDDVITIYVQADNDYIQVAPAVDN